MEREEEKLDKAMEKYVSNLKKENKDLRKFKDDHRFEKIGILIVFIVGGICGIVIGVYIG